VEAIARMLDRREDRFVRMVALYSAVLASGLTLLIVVNAAGIGVFVVFALPLFLAAWIAIRYPRRSALLLAAALVGVPGVLLLIGGLGLLVLPAAILFLVAAFRS